MKAPLRNKPPASGFTLIEVMITVAVIAIIAAVALPAYFDYVTRSRLVEGRANLADMRTRMEQFFLDNRRYPATCTTAATSTTNLSLPGNAKFFDYGCSNLGASTYTVTATDKFSPGTKFVYTVNEGNVRTTTGPWGNSGNCWISKKSGDC